METDGRRFNTPGGVESGQLQTFFTSGECQGSGIFGISLDPAHALFPGIVIETRSKSGRSAMVLSSCGAAGQCNSGRPLQTHTPGLLQSVRHTGPAACLRALAMNGEPMDTESGLSGGGGGRPSCSLHGWRAVRPYGRANHLIWNATMSAGRAPNRVIGLTGRRGSWASPRQGGDSRMPGNC